MKSGKGETIFSSLLGKISSGEAGKETEVLGKKNKDLEIWGWGRISSCRELYTPLLEGQEGAAGRSERGGGEEAGGRLHHHRLRHAERPQADRAQYYWCKWNDY